MSMNTREKLLQQIEEFLKKHKIASTTFSQNAVNHKHLLTKLRNGGDVNTGTMDKIQSYMEGYDAESNKL